VRAAEHRLAARLQDRPRLYRLARGARTALGNVLPARPVTGVGPVHPNDLMFVAGAPGAVEHYREAGEQAVRFCAAALEANAAARPPSRILDLGCGHGRCLRTLRARWPDARFVAADVDAAAVRFCAKAFDADGVVLATDRPEVPRGPFDVVWVGSVLTHLPLAATTDLLAAARAQLAPSGVVVATTHAPDTTGDLGLDEAATRDVANALARDGFAFDPYRDETSYGLAWFEPERFRAVAQTAGLRALDRAHRGWVGLQDVWSLAVSEELGT
jgi:SAM-dependent methyltransferase